MRLTLTTPKVFNGLTADRVKITRIEENTERGMKITYKMRFKDSAGNIHREWTQHLELKDGEITHYTDVTKPTKSRNVNMRARYQKIIDLATWDFDNSTFEGTIE